MKQVSIYIGLNKAGTNTQVISTIDALRIIENVISTYTDGATLRECRGIYRNNNGVISYETTIEGLFFDPDMRAIESICKTLKQVLDQESIYCNVQDIQTIAY